MTVSPVWYYVPRRQKNYGSRWHCNITVPFADADADEAVRDYYRSICDWYKEVYPKQRSVSLPIFARQISWNACWNHKRNDFNSSTLVDELRILVTLKSDADDISFRLRFAADGYIDSTHQQ
jgi:hypothetical protein